MQLVPGSGQFAAAIAVVLAKSHYTCPNGPDPTGPDPIIQSPRTLSDQVRSGPSSGIQLFTDRNLRRFNSCSSTNLLFLSSRPPTRHLSVSQVTSIFARTVLTFHTLFNFTRWSDAASRTCQAPAVLRVHTDTLRAGDCAKLLWSFWISQPPLIWSIVVLLERLQQTFYSIGDTAAALCRFQSYQLSRRQYVRRGPNQSSVSATCHNDPSWA